MRLEGDHLGIFTPSFLIERGFAEGVNDIADSQVLVGLSLMKAAIVDPRLSGLRGIFRRTIPAQQDVTVERFFVVNLSTTEGRETLLTAYTDLNFYVNAAFTSGNPSMEAGLRRCVLYLDDLVRGKEPELGGGA